MGKTPKGPRQPLWKDGLTPGQPGDSEDQPEREPLRSYEEPMGVSHGVGCWEKTVTPSTGPLSQDGAHTHTRPPAVRASLPKVASEQACPQPVQGEWAGAVCVQVSVHTCACTRVRGQSSHTALDTVTCMQPPESHKRIGAGEAPSSTTRHQGFTREQAAGNPAEPSRLPLLPLLFLLWGGKGLPLEMGNDAAPVVNHHRPLVGQSYVGLLDGQGVPL